MNWYEMLLVNAAAGIISQFVKNPKSAAQFQGVLQHIYDDLGQVLGALKMTLPPAAPAP